MACARQPCLVFFPCKAQLTSVLEDEDIPVSRDTNELLSWKQRGAVFFCDRATLCRDPIAEAKSSHKRTLQTREDQITPGFSLFVLPRWHEYESTAAQLGITMAGGVSAVARRAGSKTRWAPPWQRSCVWRRCETSPTLYYVTASVWSMRDRGRSRDHGYLYTAVQERSQDPTQMPKSQWDNTDVIQLYYQEENLEHTLHFPAGLTDFPVRADFSAAWPVLGGLCLLQPHIVYLFLYLHYRTRVRQQNSLSSFLEVPLFSVKDMWRLPGCSKIQPTPKV